MRLGSCRHDGIQHLSPTAHVVVGHPARETEQVRREQRLLVQHPCQFLDRALGSIFMQADAIADGLPVAASERRLHALTDRDLVADGFRHGIGVGVIERAVEHDLCEQPRGGQLRLSGLAEEVALNRLTFARITQKRRQFRGGIHCHQSTCHIAPSPRPQKITNTAPC